MKIVALSDTHLYHNDIKIPEGDVLIHCGDATAMGTLREVSDFTKWFVEQPHDIKIFVPGNHDFLFEDSPELAVQMIDQWDNCYCLIDDELVADGVRFFGYPWTPKYGDWAFMEDRESHDLMYSTQNIPEDVDVLITHGPPHGILDTTVRMRQGFGAATEIEESVGCELLRLRVEAIMPKIHVFGHIHEGHGNATITYGDETTHFYNTCICDEKYKAIRKPTEIEVK